MSRLQTVKELLSGDRRARGKVLDAGTGGGHMTAILAGFGPVELVSVSLDEAAFGEARPRLPAAGERQVRFLLGDLSDPGLLPEAGFDLVVGDYLLAAAAGDRPFREAGLLAGLVRALAPGGLLILTGMEPFEPSHSPEQEAARTLLRWWAALTYLSGEEMYREVPAAWAVERLREAAEAGRGAAALKVADPLFTAPLTWSLAQLHRLAEEGARRAAASGDARLAAFARRHLARLCRRAARLPGFASGEGKVTWGRDWVVRAGLQLGGEERVGRRNEAPGRLEAGPGGASCRAVTSWDGSGGGG